MEFDTSYLNTTPGKYKVSCLTLGAIGLLAMFIANVSEYEYNSTASSAFVVTLILLIILLCVPSIRQSSLWLIAELIINGLLTIAYAIATIYIFKLCLHFATNNFRLLPFAGTLVATVCAVFATLTYAADTLLKFREVTESRSTSNV